jgi:hypothetical protein
MEDGFVNCRSGELIAGRKCPGLILPLEFGKDFHEHEYLQNGKPQSAKLLMKRGDDGQDEFYAHIAFEFTPEPMKTETILGIDRGTLARRRRRTQAPDADLGYEEFLDKL